MNLPEFCRVMAVSRPTHDSEIHFEVWMPPAGTQPDPSHAGAMRTLAAASPLTAAKLPLITKAAIWSCDAVDGVTDGVIDDSRRRNFDPGALLCKSGDNDNCLTAPQVESVRKIYEDARNPRTGERIFAG